MQQAPLFSGFTGRQANPASLPALKAATGGPRAQEVKILLLRQPRDIRRIIAAVPDVTGDNTSQILVNLDYVFFGHLSVLV